MLIKTRYVASLLLLTSLVTGCGPGSTDVSQQQLAVPTTDILKSGLKGPSETGTLGSEIITIEEAVAKMKAENTANAPALEKDLAELKAANTPAKIKAKAKEMLGRL